MSAQKYSVEELPTDKTLMIVPEKPLPIDRLNNLAKKLTKLGVKGIISNTKMKVDDLRYSVEELEKIDDWAWKNKDGKFFEQYWMLQPNQLDGFNIIGFIKEHSEEVKKILSEK